MIVRGYYAPIVGRISMDLTLADVTGLSEVSVGDEVVLLGTVDGLNVDAREHASLANTVPLLKSSAIFPSGCRDGMGSRSIRESLH